MDLIKRFEKEGIPLTVATIDMDWHWVDLKKEFSGVPGTNPADIKSGWTGYSWNTHLFPDYREFLKWLKSQNLKITVNLHPADGVRFLRIDTPILPNIWALTRKQKRRYRLTVPTRNIWKHISNICIIPMKMRA